MAEYSKLVMTTKGQALQAKMIAGTGNVQFTKVSASSTQYQLSQLEGLTSLSGVQQTTLISKVERTNNVAIKVEAAFSNASLRTGYYMRTLGLYALDPQEGEILYAVCIETSNNCYFPPYNGITVSGAFIQMYQTVGNSDNVSLNVNPGAYATIGDIQSLEAEIADLKGFIGYTDDDVYGVEVDFKNRRFTRLAGAVNRTAGEGFDSINAFGGRRRCNVTNEGDVIAYYGDAGFTTTGKLTQQIVIGEGDTAKTYPVGTIVQVMVEQPKFYYKVVPLETEKKGKGCIMRKARYYVSDHPKMGFKLHPDFIVDGVENDFSYHSAFTGSLWDASASAYILDDAQVADFANDMLCSIANAKPISGVSQNLTRANTRALAHKRGTGWEQLTIQAATSTALLFLIEYASFDAQKHLGAGNSSQSWDGTNKGMRTGATISLGNKSGAVVNDEGIQATSYRGEENVFADMWKWQDGINRHVKDGENAIYIADHGFADSTGTGVYKDAGISPYVGEGYISAFCYSEEFDWLFIAGECSGNSSLPVGDYYWNTNQGTEWTVSLFGGSFSSGGKCGVVCVDVYGSPSYRAATVSGRLVYHKKVAKVA